MVATAAIKWQSAIGIHVHGQACVRCGASASALFPPFRTTFLPRGRFGGRAPVGTRGRSGLAWQTRRPSKYASISLERESKQCYEHEHEYQKCVHLLTCLVYARVKDYQHMNRQAPVIRVDFDDVHNSGQISLSTRISIGLFSAFFVDNGGRYTIPQWACPFLNSCSIAIDH